MKVVLNTLPSHSDLQKQIKAAPIMKIGGRLKKALNAWNRCAIHLQVANQRLVDYKKKTTTVKK